jgi:hypothetical protein
MNQLVKCYLFTFSISFKVKEIFLQDLVCVTEEMKFEKRNSSKKPLVYKIKCSPQYGSKPCTFFQIK